MCVPQVRDTGQPYRSRLMSFLDGNSDVADHLVTETPPGDCRPGTSRTPSETPPASCSSRSPPSRRSPTRCDATTRPSSPATCQRSRSSTSCDAIFESLRCQGAKETLFVAWSINSAGRKHLLHLAVGNKESAAA